MITTLSQNGYQKGRNGIAMKRRYSFRKEDVILCYVIKHSNQNLLVLQFCLLNKIVDWRDKNQIISSNIKYF